METNPENHFTQKDRELISHQGYQLDTLIGRFDEFQLVRKIVYTGVGMVLVASMGAGIALIIK